MKRHLKRLAMRKSWPTMKKGIKFIINPNPGPYKKEESIPISILLKDILKLAKISKEVKKILNKNVFLVNGIIRKDPHFPLGVMDIISIGDKHYRLLLNKKSKFIVLPIKKEESIEKISKIIGKKILKKKKIQINLYDSRNIIVEKDSYKTGDSLIISNNKIKKHLKFEKGAVIYIIGGKYIGEIGKLEEIKKHKGITKDAIIIDSGKKKIKTSKNYAFVIENESNATIKD